MLLLLLLSASSSTMASNSKETGIRADTSTLEYVHSIWRHGDRTPAELLSLEDIRKWPEGIGELTEEGAAQQYRLGKWLRRRYGEWLGDFRRDTIYIRSSDYNRTLMSAMANMAGLFPPKRPLTPGINWQPIPVHTRPKATDKELYEDAKCPMAELEMSKQWKSKKADGIRKKYARELAFFAEKLNLKNMELKVTWAIYDNFFCEQQHNIPWPKWMNSTLFSRVTDLYNEVSQLDFHTETLRRLRGGTLLEEILNRFKDKINGNLGENAKFYAYSAHDSTIAALLATFGIFYEIYPKYATCLLVEMHKLQNETRIIRVFHKNETDIDRLIEYSIPGCSPPCTLQKLLEDLSRYFPSDWETECGLTSNFEFVYLVIIFGLLTATICSSTMFLLEKYKKKQKFSGEDTVPMLNVDDSD
uniref:Lysosomal acid phosphatase n=2 Tax=Caenorhabditis tropicalis TaxID=1561998 RepID=A0A1I7TKZ6_9PELO